jgi:uncharacterized membrane protein YqaE (UPF0057 family)
MKQFIYKISLAALILIIVNTAFAVSVPTIIRTDFTFTPTLMPGPSAKVVIPYVAVTPDYKSAINEFKTISKTERKERITEAKKLLKEYKKQKKAGDNPSTNTVLLAILCVILPPLAVYLHQGEINNKFWISLLLTLLFVLPGIIYAFIVVFGGK